MHTQLIESLESRRMLAAATVGIYTSDSTASETDPGTTGKGVFVIKRPTGSTAKPLTVNLELRSASTATSVLDFKALPKTIIIPQGKSSANLNLIPIDDSKIEVTEKVVLGVKTGSGYTIVHDKATVSIADNDTPQIGVYATDSAASETDPSGTGKGVFTFHRSAGAIDSPITLNYTVRNTSTAISGDDFVPLGGQITILKGHRSATLNLIPIDDSIDESDETVTVVLQNGAFISVNKTATITIADNDDPAPTNWFGDARRYRTSLSIDTGNFARTDQPIDTSVNFSSILSDVGASGSLIDNSIKVVEVSADGTSNLDDAITYQFDHDLDFNASSKASGDLVILATGNTNASTVRHYQVYFDTTGSFSAPSFTPLVVTDGNTTDQGAAAISIDTQTAKYWLQKQDGGFSSIEDKSAQHNDWLSFDPTSGSHAGGEFRGTPNAVFPGGGFHAGFNDGSSTIVHSGPLKTTIDCTMTVDKGGGGLSYKMRYEIYPTFVRATMVQASDSYWFLYEGTPGGSIDSNDSVVRSDGTTTSIDTSWNDDDGLGNGSDAAGSNGEEWAYFHDSGVDKFIYFAHNTTDDLKDSYYQANDNGEMTVFGFGRDNDAGGADHLKMTAQNNSFTFGIVDGGGNFSDAAAAIDGQHHVLTGSVSTSEKLG